MTLFATLMTASWLPAAQAENSGELGAALPALLTWAEQHNHDLQSQDWQTVARSARVEAADALPDPMFRIELQDLDKNDPELLPGNAGRTKYSLSQNFPWWGTRDLRRDLALTQHSQAEAARAGSRAQLRGQVISAFAMRLYADRALTLQKELMAINQQLESVALRRYETATGSQQEALAAQLESTNRQAELYALESQLASANAWLNALLSLPPTTKLAMPKGWPQLSQPLTWEHLHASLLAANPQLQSQQQQIRGAEQTKALVEKERYPNFTLGVSQIQRDERLDSFELMVEANLPIWVGARDARERAATAELAQAEQQREALRDTLTGEMGMAFAAYQDAVRQLDLRRQRLLPQAEASYRSAQAGLRSGTGSLALTLQSLQQWQALRLDVERLEAQRLQQLANLDRLSGLPLADELVAVGGDSVPSHTGEGDL